MLSSFIRDKKYFTIEFLNDRICYFDYSSSEARNKPPKPFTTKMLASDSTKLHLSGMSLSIVMLSLFYSLNLYLQLHRLGVLLLICLS